MCNLRFRAELSLRTLTLAGRAVPGEVAGVKAVCPRRERHSIGSGPRGFLPGRGDHGEAGFGQVASERGRESPHGHARPAGSPAAPPGRGASDVPGTPGKPLHWLFSLDPSSPRSRLASPRFAQVPASRRRGTPCAQRAARPPCFAASLPLVLRSRQRLPLLNLLRRGVSPPRGYAPSLLSPLATPAPPHVSDTSCVPREC